MNRQTEGARGIGGSGRVARWWIRLASVVVPRADRADWLREWRAELDALESAGAAGYPGRLAFVWGALPHAFWTRTEGWTVDSVFQDLRYAGRVLRRAPGFTMVAALTLALGIGANATIFSLVNAVMLRAPDGIAEPDRMVQVARSYETDPRWDNFSWPALRLIREEARSLSGVAGYSTTPFVLGRGAQAEQVIGQYVTGDYFSVLGVRPQLGRLIRAADALDIGGHPVAVISHGLWHRRFGSDAGVVGQTIYVGSQPYTVIGVAPEGFAGLETIGPVPGLWVPMTQQPAASAIHDAWGTSWIDVVGRLEDDVTIEAARSSMALVDARLREAASVNEEILVLLADGVGLSPDGRVQAKALSIVLLMIVAVVLLLTCTNVANLFLARATARTTEVSVRVALGAGRGRLARQLVTESVTLALLATAVAVPLVLGSGRFLPLVFPFPLAVRVGADARVLAFLVCIGVTSGVLFGLVPAWVVSRRDIAQALREGLTGVRHGTRVRDALVVAQLAISLGLVAGAALLGRSVMNADGARPGFEPEGLTAAFVDLAPTGRYDRQSGVDFFDRLQREAEALPGVAGVTLANQTPLVGGHTRGSAFPEGLPDAFFEAEYLIVGPRYFETMGIALVAGRSLAGTRETEQVVVVNQALAEMFWPGESALDKRIGGQGGLWRVVGVARDVQMRSLRDRGRPAVYYPMAQAYSSSMVLHIRGIGYTAVDADLVRATVASLDPGLPVAAVVSLRDALTDSLAETKTIGYLVGAFAILALVLAAIGLYGVVSYGASQRVREFAIRIALGARPGSLVRLILARGLVISALGIGGGVLIAFGLGRALRALLFGVGAGDIPTLGAAAALLLATAWIAAWFPARRASHMDAAHSLRR